LNINARRAASVRQARPGQAVEQLALGELAAGDVAGELRTIAGGRGPRRIRRVLEERTYVYRSALYVRVSCCALLRSSPVHTMPIGA